MTDSIKNNSTVAKIILLLFKYATIYFAYGLFSPVILICVFFLIFSVINLTGGDLSLLGIDKFIYLLEMFGFSVSEKFDETDILSAYAILSLLVFIVGMLTSFLIKRFKKNDKPLLRVNKLKLGFYIITFLMFSAQASIFFPRSAENAAQTIPLLILFWGMAIILYAIFTALINFTNIIDPFTTKFSYPKVIHLNPKMEKLILRLIPYLDIRIGKIYRESVASGKWEEIKKNMDPIEAEKIEQYHENNSINRKHDK